MGCFYRNKTRVIHTHLTKHSEQMKEIVLRIEDSAFDKFMGFVQLCPMVEVICDGDCVETRDEVDQSFASSIMELKNRKVFSTPTDYVYIMKAANDGAICKSLYFISPSDFINYLDILGLKDLVCRSTLYKHLGNISGKYPDWTFADSDKISQYEVLRRKNIIVQFLSAFMRAKRRITDAHTDN